MGPPYFDWPRDRPLQTWPRRSRTKTNVQNFFPRGRARPFNFFSHHHNIGRNGLVLSTSDAHVVASVSYTTHLISAPSFHLNGTAPMMRIICD